MLEIFIIFFFVPKFSRFAAGFLRVAEPSPTTGSFFKPQLMQAYVENAAILFEKKSTSDNVVDERTSSGYEFRFRTGVSSTSGLSSAGISVPVGINQNGLVTHQDQQYSQSATPSFFGTTISCCSSTEFICL
ncbi:uncharacterized protein LOC121750174 isoform X1 [Salvia splendens]|nr:uncharacterized protein LOC121750174 isoform X1 [Salvia splendens]